MPPDTESDPSLTSLFARSLSEAAASRVDAGEQRREMTAAIQALAAAHTDHNAGAATRHAALLAALSTRDAGAVAAVAAVTSERAAASSWLRESTERVAREVWPLLRVPVGVALAYYGAAWSGALPASLMPASAQPSVPVSIVAPDVAPVAAPTIEEPLLEDRQGLLP
jgi:hypothetical protein